MCDLFLLVMKKINGLLVYVAVGMLVFGFGSWLAKGFGLF